MIKESKNIVLLNQFINTKTKENAINILQNLYKLKNKTETEIHNLGNNNIKTRYISALELAKTLFVVKNTHKISLVEGKEKNSNLKEILLIATSQNIKKTTNSKLAWPLNQIDQNNDKIALLITFFKNQVVKVETKLNDKASNIEINANVFFKLKSYDLVNLFYAFKVANPSANDFGTYNAYLDNDHNTKGLDIFKKYLLTLKAVNSIVEIEDLKDVKFTKGKINNSNKKISATLTFSYQELKTTKVINDFIYKRAYQLSIKSGKTSKMADEVSTTDIDANNLPSGVSIELVILSTITPDGSTVKLTFSSGNIREQELGGFVSYQQKAQALLTSATSNDFSISNKADIFPSEFDNKQSILNQLKAKASSLNDPAKTKVKNILGTASVTFNPNDQTNELKFQIVIGNVSKTFTITGLTGINTIVQKIDAEVAKKTMPSIKNGSEWKNSSRVQKTDIEITPDDDSLISTVINVSVKTGLPASDRGTTVIVTIEVSSSVIETKTATYNVELGGFTSNLKSINFNVTILENTNNNDFVISNKTNILPSNFNDKNLIKNVLKRKVEASEQTNNVKTHLKNLIDNNLKITFIPYDSTGALNFQIQSSVWNKTFIITGFQTSSS